MAPGYSRQPISATIPQFCEHGRYEVNRYPVPDYI